MAVILKGEALERELRGREPLTGSIKLRERDSESEAVYDDFEIEGVLHAGGSCICYKATRFFENSDMAETGTLKEFYPVDSYDNSLLSYNLKRYELDAGVLAKQLFSKESTLSNFINAQNEFYACYKKVSDIKLDNKENDNFFPPIRIYRGIPAKNESNNHTIYIWHPGDSSLTSFDDYLTEMQKRINDEIEAPGGNINFLLAKELHIILQVIKSLAIGIQNLHYKNLLHLDIKPSNFGVRYLGEGDNISVSLFDVNTIYSRSNPFARTAGTPHFRAPELIHDVFNNYYHLPVGCQSDIYSLGATLYNAIIVGFGERGLYEIDKFSDMDTELSRSLLFEYSEYNSRAELHDLLANILKRSLARHARDYSRGIENYVSVGEFLEDISEADKLVESQLTIAREEGNDKKALIHTVNKEDYYADKVDGGAVSSMQCLLYDFPLYDYIDKEKNQLNLLVLGAGAFGQKFIDIAFELSQVKGCYLNITVLSKDKKSDKARYLDSRPELKNYFWVDGIKPKFDGYGTNGEGDFVEGYGYGKICFIGIDLSEGPKFTSDSDNIERLKDLLGQNNEKFGYVFISMSDEELNRKIACAITESDLLDNKKSIVNFVTYKDILEEEKKKKKKRRRKKFIGCLIKLLMIVLKQLRKRISSLILFLLKTPLSITRTIGLFRKWHLIVTCFGEMA